MEGLYDWMGLSPYPAKEGTGVFRVPFPNKNRPDYPMGVTITNNPNGKMLTFSCAVCHSSNLFGKTIIGLHNKRPRSNKLFVLATKYIPLVHPGLFKMATGATSGEVREFKI